MPKIKQSNANKLQSFVNKFPDFKTDGKILFCKICNRSVSADKIFNVKQHLQSAKHINLKKKTNQNTQFFLENVPVILQRALNLQLICVVHL